VGATDAALLLDGFTAAVALLGAALVVVLVTWAVRRPSVVPLLRVPTGILMTAAFVVAVWTGGWGIARLAVGLAVLAIAARVVPRGPKGPAGTAALAAVLSLPGALLVVSATSLEGWGAIALTGAVIVLAPIVARFHDRDADRGAGPMLAALTCLGTYVAVPDTETALVLVGASAPWVAIGWPTMLGRLGAAGGAALTGTLAWVAAEGAITRPPAIVGSLATLGLLVAEPLAARLPVLPPRTGWLSTIWVVIPAHGALVLVGARVIGFRADVASAAGLAVLTLVVAVALARLTGAGRMGTAVPERRKDHVTHRHPPRGRGPTRAGGSGCIAPPRDVRWPIFDHWRRPGS
jgi:hypothetical protein